MILLAYGARVCNNICKVKAMKKKVFVIAVLSLVACMLASVTCFAAEETNIKPVDNMGDIFFYILAAILVVALIAICIVFRYSKKFVIKERERLIEQKKEYVPAKEIRIRDGAIRKVEKTATVEKKQ